MKESSQSLSLANAPVRMLSQFRVIDWVSKVAGPLTLLVIPCIWLLFSIERKWIATIFLLGLAAYYFALQLFGLKKINNAKQIDVSATAMLLPAMLLSSFAPFLFESGGNVTVVVGMIILGSLCYVSNFAFVIWLIATSLLFIGGLAMAGEELLFPDWINILLVGLGIALIVRFAIQKNYNAMLGRLQQLERERTQTQKLESLGGVASGVAHDFNNYMSAIIAFCEPLDLNKEITQSRASEYQEIIGEIVKTAQNASGVCEQILMFAGDSTMEKNSLDLVELVRENKMFLQAVVSKQINLQTELPDSPVCIVANRQLIQQTMVNLVKNSSEALGDRTDGLVNISVRVSEELPATGENSIRVGELPDRPNSTYAILSINDNGPGIASDDLKRIFEPSFSSKDAGHGLGLAITADVVRNHEGVMYCHSDPTGLTVDLLFLLDDSPVETEKKSASLVSAQEKSGLRILLVDDDPTIVKSVELAFSHFGHAMESVQSGREALELLDAGTKFDCIILDYSMPNMNGLELLQAIRERGISTPAILCSGYLDLPTYDTVTPDLTLRKPYTISHLRDSISELCQQEPR